MRTSEARVPQLVSARGDLLRSGWAFDAAIGSWFMGLIHLTRVFTTYVDDMSHWLCSCVRVFQESSSISSLDPLQIVSNTTLAHSHLQLPTSGPHMSYECEHYTQS